MICLYLKGPPQLGCQKRFFPLHVYRHKHSILWHPVSWDQRLSPIFPFML